MRKKGGRVKSKAGLAQALMFEKEIKNLSDQEMKELLLINMYKMKLLRAQLEAVTQILVKNKLTTHEEVWNETNNNFQENI